MSLRHECTRCQADQILADERLCWRCVLDSRVSFYTPPSPAPTFVITGYRMQTATPLPLGYGE